MWFVQQGKRELHQYTTDSVPVSFHRHDALIVYHGQTVVNREPRSTREVFEPIDSILKPIFHGIRMFSLSNVMSFGV